MNWTGGNLHRHSKTSGSAARDRQRQYFAKVRTRLQNGTLESPYAFEPSFARDNEVDLEAGRAVLVARPASRDSTSMLSPSGLGKDCDARALRDGLHHPTVSRRLPQWSAEVERTARPKRKRSTSRHSSRSAVDESRSRLLQQADWVGLKLTRPAAAPPPLPVSRDLIGKRRKLAHGRRRSVHAGNTARMVPIDVEQPQEECLMSGALLGDIENIRVRIGSEALSSQVAPHREAKGAEGQASEDESPETMLFDAEHGMTTILTDRANNGSLSSDSAQQHYVVPTYISNTSALQPRPTVTEVPVCVDVNDAHGTPRILESGCLPGTYKSGAAGISTRDHNADTGSKNSSVSPIRQQPRQGSFKLVFETSPSRHASSSSRHLSYKVPETSKVSQLAAHHLVDARGGSHCEEQDHSNDVNVSVHRREAGPAREFDEEWRSFLANGGDPTSEVSDLSWPRIASRSGLTSVCAVKHHSDPDAASSRAPGALTIQEGPAQLVPNTSVPVTDRPSLTDQATTAPRSVRDADQIWRAFVFASQSSEEDDDNADIPIQDDLSFRAEPPNSLILGLPISTSSADLHTSHATYGADADGLGTIRETHSTPTGHDSIALLRNVQNDSQTMSDTPPEKMYDERDSMLTEQVSLKFMTSQRSDIPSIDTTGSSNDSTVSESTRRVMFTKPPIFVGTEDRLRPIRLGLNPPRLKGPKAQCRQGTDPTSIYDIPADEDVSGLEDIEDD